jgi:hypothetical protein
MPAPLIAMGVAAGVNALSNIIGSSMQANAARQAQKAAARGASSVAEGYDSVKGVYDTNKSAIDDYSGKIDSVYGDNADAIKKYKELLNSDMSDAIYKPSTWTDNHDVSEYYDKAWKLNNQTQLDALEASASNAGRLYSSGLQNQMLSTASANASKAYKDAMEAYLKEKGIDVDIWKGEETNKQAAAKQYLDQYKTQVESIGNYIGNGLGLQGDVLGATISNNNDKANTYTNYLTNYANLLAQAGSYSPSTSMPAF